MKIPNISILTLTATVLLFSLSTARASTIVGWDLSSNTTNSPATATTVDSNLSSAPVVSMGPGLNPNYYNANAGYMGYATVDTSPGWATADFNGTYFEFTLTPGTGYSMTINGINAPHWVAQGVPATAQTIDITSSLDSYSSSLGSATPSLVNETGNWSITLGTPITSALPVTFRIEISENFAWKNAGFLSSQDGLDHSLPWPYGPIGNSLQVNGQISSTVPEPSTWAMLLCGLGVLILFRRYPCFRKPVGDSSSSR